MISRTELAALHAYRNAADYLAAAQIYLQSNCLLEEPLRPEHIKPRLLGHWGTVPGLNLITAHLDRIITKHNARMLLVTGPGHGAPATLANLFLEGSLGELYPDLARSKEGAIALIRKFSWPGGFPSHLTPMVPGVIHEGGELGYALAKAFGAALDHPELLVACVVGDGEAETGPTATAWHGTKFLDPKTSGAVLPILHVNGYKISSSTLFAAMSDNEIEALFCGYGWSPRIVTADGPEELDASLADAMEGAYRSIRKIQHAARSGSPEARPAWPMIVLRTPKGMGCPKAFGGHAIEGSWRAHQVPITNPRTDPAALAAVEKWLRSYGPHRFFDPRGRLAPEFTDICPTGERRLGMNPYANGGNLRRALDAPSMEPFALPAAPRGSVRVSAMEPVGRYLAETLRRTETSRNFRLMCPDETTSNKLGAVFEATSRAFVWPTGSADEHSAPDGRVLEMLSEHMCQGWLEGYVLTGGHGIFPCYEAFIPIIDGMMNQYAKFLKQSREVPWRAPVSSLNYLLTSDGWRQDHNGYSHQGPGFINALLDKKAEVLRIYLASDASSLLTVVDHCLKSTGYINLIIATKNEMPQWLSLPEATALAKNGAAVWPWASSDGDEMPDVVLACAGATPTLETLAAAWMLRRDAPRLRVRVVNVLDLLVLEPQSVHPHGLAEDAFCTLFPRERPVIFAFHGYPSAVKQLVFDRPESSRFHIFGYKEEGTTTTPFDMTVRNGISRYHLAIEALRRSGERDIDDLIARYEDALVAHRAFIEANGHDPEEIERWQWTP